MAYRPLSVFCLGLILGAGGLQPLAPGGWIVPGAWAEEKSPVAALEEALLLPDLFKVMQKEGLDYGQKLDDQFMAGDGGVSWQAEVARVYDPARIGQIFHEAFAAELGQSKADVGHILDFLATDLGRRSVVLELSAREAFLDEAVEESAQVAYEQMEARQDPRLAMVRAYVEESHIIDLNVASALNANVAFLIGLSEAAKAGDRMAEDEIIAQVWGQEADVRAETETWLMSFLLMAYAPLSDDELKAYLDFSLTPDGVALNQALFAAYDAMFVSLSGDLGRSVGRWMAGTSL